MLNMFIFWFSWHGILVGRISKMTRKIVDYNSQYSPYRSDEQHGDGYSHDIAYTLKSLKAEIRSCKADNERII